MTRQQDKPGRGPEGRPSGWEDFKRFFLRGLAALLPALLTIALLVWSYNVLEEYVGRYVTRTLIYVCVRTLDEPKLVDLDDALTYGTPLDEWREDGQRLTVEYKIITHNALRSLSPQPITAAQLARSRALWEIVFAKYKLSVIGFLIAIVFVYFIGVFLASLLGRTLWRMTEGALYRIPLVGTVYPNLKQVTDFILSERKLAFAGVVAVEYPRRGIWSLGLRTGSALDGIQRVAADARLVTVFIPSSPTPVTGYVITVPLEDVRELALSIDEALRFIISGGVIQPAAKPPELGTGEWRASAS